MTLVLLGIVLVIAGVVVLAVIVGGAAALVAFRDRGETEPTPADAPLPDAAAQDPNHQAAMLLRLLLSGSIGVERARQMWPTGPLSVPDAAEWIDYFQAGIWGQGGRDPAIDRVVEAIAADLTHGRARTSESEPVPALPGWVDTIPLTRPGPDDRDANAIAGRLVTCLLLSERASAEQAPRAQGERIVDTCHVVAAQLGLDPFLSDAERAILYAGLGDLRPEPRLTAHWRTECAPVLAWAIGMLADVPPPGERFDPSRLEIEPTSQAAVRRMLTEAVLRTPEEQAALKTRLAEERRATARSVKGHEKDPDRAHPNSRALERYRAVAWLTGFWATLEEAPTHPDAAAAPAGVT